MKTKNKISTIGFRCTEDVKAIIEIASEYEERSISQIVERLVKASLKAYINDSPGIKEKCIPYLSRL